MKFQQNDISICFSFFASLPFVSRDVRSEIYFEPDLLGSRPKYPSAAHIRVCLVRRRISGRDRSRSQPHERLRDMSGR